MARPPINLNPQDFNANTYYDRYGRIALRIISEKAVSYLPDGTPVERKEHHCVELKDGSIWFPGQLFTQPPIHIGICHRCRYPAYRLVGRREISHGCTRLDQMKRCCVCHSLCCPEHIEIVAGKWVCMDCERSFRIKHVAKRLIINLFFK